MLFFFTFNNFPSKAASFCRHKVSSANTCETQEIHRQKNTQNKNVCNFMQGIIMQQMYNYMLSEKNIIN